FIVAIIPGILLMLIFIALIFLIHRKQAAEDNRDPKKPFEKRKIGIKKYLVTVITSAIIMGTIFVGIYLGVFTATEAGAIGAMVSLIAVVILGKFNYNLLKTSLIETIKVTGMVMFIMIGAQIFARFVALSLLTNKLMSLLTMFIQNELIIILMLVALYFLLFMFIEGAAVIVMTVPITLPIITEAGIDVLWFGVVVGVTCTIGLLTPPVGLSVFAVSGATKIQLESIFKITTILSFLAMIIVLILLIIFPGMITWLPGTM